MTHRNGCMVLLLLLGGIQASTAQEDIRITVPKDLENLEGDLTGSPNFMGTPFRFQDLYLASEFAALPDTHEDISLSGLHAVSSPRHGDRNVVRPDRLNRSLQSGRI